MDPIAALGSSNVGSPTERYEQCRAQSDLNNLKFCDGDAGGAHLDHVVVVGSIPPPTMNLASAGQMFSSGLKNGFYMQELKGLVSLLGDETASADDKTVALIDVQTRLGVANIVGKIATHTAESLQTVVTKSG